MAHRKSMMHPRVEELSGPPSMSSPMRRRSNIIHTPPDLDTSLDFETPNNNDDETERRQRRMEKQRPSPNVDKDRRKSLGLSFVSGMSNPQITDGVTECIKMSAENKINTKNAFSFKMIDFMTYMVNKNNTTMDNLQMASTSLDVSTKIYGFRVDGVHHDLLKMSGGLRKEEEREGRQSLGTENENNEAPDEAEIAATQQQKKKKKSRAKIFGTVESLRGKIQTIDPTMMRDSDNLTTDMLHQAVLPVHATNDLYLHAYIDVIFDTVTREIATGINNAPVNCLKLERFDHLDLCPNFVNFEFLGWTPEEDINLTPEEKPQTPIEEDGFRFDLDASLRSDENDDHGAPVFMDYDTEENENAEGCRRVGPAPANIVDFREVVIKANKHQNFEYSYVNDFINLRSAGPSHWKIIFPAKDLGGSRVVEGCGQQPIKRVKASAVIALIYDEDTYKLRTPSFIVTEDKETRISDKTKRSRLYTEKLTLDRDDVDCDNMNYCKYYIRPNHLKHFPRRGQSNAVDLPDEVGDYNYNNANDTLEYCPNVDDDDDDHHADNNDNNDNINNVMDAEDEIVVATQAFTGDNLVEAPKITNQVFIPFSQRAKKVDMRALKRAIWKHLTTETNDMTEPTEGKQTDGINAEKIFSDTYKNLPKMLTKSNAESISVPIAFISLLHLANEKNLEITSSEDCSDLYIRQA